jgi:hypothetical protein
MLASTSFRLPVIQVDEYLRNRIEAAGLPAHIQIGDELVYASKTLTLFYQQRLYRPVWSDDRGLLPQADELLRSLRLADLEGLDSSVYHLVAIDTLIKEVQVTSKTPHRPEPRRLVDVDLLLTDAFLVYASHLLSGRVDPQTFDSEWHVVIELSCRERIARDHNTE